MQISPYFTPMPISGYNMPRSALTAANCPEEALAFKDNFLSGNKTLWGIPFELGPDTGENLVYSGSGGQFLDFSPVLADYLVFAHTAAMPKPEAGGDGIARHFRGDPPLGDKVCDYIIHYAGGEEETVPIRCRFEINNMVL